MSDNNHKILVYTREPEKKGYTASLGNSVHFAYSAGNNEFMPLNQNYGILFATATINEQNVIVEKGLKNPFIFYLDDGSFGITAVRTDNNGNDDIESKGCVLFWTSPDLINFNEHGLVKLHEELFVETAVCGYNEKNETYEIHWRGSDGNYYINTLKTLTDFKYVPQPILTDKQLELNSSFNLKDIKPGNTICVKPAEAKEILDNWVPLYNTSVLPLENISVSSREQLENIKATAIYSDGSSAYKNIEWDLTPVNFSKPGKYRVQGKITNETFNFPLAVGYADPVVLPYNGKYYFLATNDNVNAVGLFVREADNAQGLFLPGVKEHIILNYDEERNFIQTFWAPEFHIIGEDLYILFAVGGKAWAPQSHMMKLKKGGSIINPEDWETPIRVKKADGSFLTEDGITLDMTYFKADNNHYLVWSYRKGIGTPLDTGSMLYIAQTNEATPWILISEPVLLSRPLYGWENLQGTINNEGPYPLITKDKVYIAYSGGAAGGYTYSVGFLSINKGEDYLNPAKWVKSPAPLLSYYSVNGEFGPGHNSFYQDEYGNVMNAYHAQKTIERVARCTAIRRVHFNKNGFPVLNMSADMDLREDLINVTAEITVV